MAMTDEGRRTTPAAVADGYAAPAGGPLVPAGGDPPARNQDAHLDEPMTLQEHLKELRDRIIKAGLGVLIGMMAGFYFAQYAITYFLYLFATKAPPGTELTVTSPGERVVVYFKIAFYFGVAFAMPVIIYQFIRFLAPGLTRAERRYVYLTMPFIVFFFVLGVAFASGVAIPNMFHFLLAFGDFTYGDQSLRNFIRLEELLGFFSNLSLWTGVTFQLPVIMFLLASLNIVPYRVLRQTRKYASVGLMVLAAIITPTPDPINMLIVWAPMYLLFELGLLTARFARPRKRDALA